MRIYGQTFATAATGTAPVLYSFVKIEEILTDFK
jgi:hypothetical protein